MGESSVLKKIGVVWGGIVLLGFAVLYIGGYKEAFWGWLREDVGAWAPPVLFVGIALSFVVPPILVGVVQGVREASKQDKPK